MDFYFRLSQVPRTILFEIRIFKILFNKMRSLWKSVSSHLKVKWTFETWANTRHGCCFSRNSKSDWPFGPTNDYVEMRECQSTNCTDLSDSERGADVDTGRGLTSALKSRHLTLMTGTILSSMR